MAQAENFDAAALTDTGRVRDHNEDAALSRPDLGLFVVADGMGGHSAGDFASQTIVEAAQSVGRAASLDDLQARFLERLSGAHRDIARRADQLGGTVGATVVSLMIHGERWACAWAGDSRVYRLRDGHLAQLTHDHTEVAEMIARGSITASDGPSHPRRNVITRAVGVDDGADCDMVEGDLVTGDVFLLCSDGLNEHLDDHAIAAHLSRAAGAEDICRRLIEDTLGAGARDNVTCVVVRILAAQPGE